MNGDVWTRLEYADGCRARRRVMSERAASSMRASWKYTQEKALTACIRLRNATSDGPARQTALLPPYSYVEGSKTASVMLGESGMNS